MTAVGMDRTKSSDSGASKPWLGKLHKTIAGSDLFPKKKPTVAKDTILDGGAS